VVAGEPIPLLYVQMDETGIPVVKKETVGRPGKTEGHPAHTRGAKLGCVFTQTAWEKKDGYPIRDPDSTTSTGTIETAEEFGRRLYREACRRGWGRAQKKVVMATGQNGFGIWPRSTFPARFKLWTFTTRLSTCGT